jgi:hypothetical protein
LLNPLSLFKKKSKKLYEIDSTFYLFVLGLIIGVLIFFSIKALWVLFLYLVFIGSILIHDIIQIYLAKRFGLDLKKFVLYPFGSKKMYGEDFEKPLHEFIYAISGLLTYILLMVIFFVVGVFFIKGFWPVEIVLQSTLTSQTFSALLLQYPLFAMFWINFLLFIFNLFIFAIPMDGGRLLKALLTFVFGEFSANKLVPTISKIVSIVVLVFGIVYWDLIIVVIGLFVLIISSKEAKEMEVLMVLEDKKVNDFTTKVKLKFNPDITILDCFEKMKKDLIPDALVMYDKNKFGVIDTNIISSISKELWASKKVGEAAIEVEPATDKEKLGYIAQYMVEKNLSILPVVHSRTHVLIGIIRRSDLGDFIKIHKIF